MGARKYIGRLQELPTPFYFYDMDLLRSTLATAVSEASRYGYRIHYALKANFDPRIVETIRKAGLGADCVSGNEVRAAIEAGFPAEGIVFAGVGKTDREIEYALGQDIFSFNCESAAEMEAINAIAERMGRRARVALRINPDVDPMTHRYISTGKADNKFGISYTEVDRVIASLKRLSHLEIVGLHFHVGSQIGRMEVFERLCERVNAIRSWFRARGIVLRHLNMGGGLAVDYENPDPGADTRLRCLLRRLQPPPRNRAGTNRPFRARPLAGRTMRRFGDARIIRQDDRRRNPSRHRGRRYDRPDPPGPVRSPPPDRKPDLLGQDAHLYRSRSDLRVFRHVRHRHRAARNLPGRSAGDPDGGSLRHGHGFALQSAATCPEPYTATRFRPDGNDRPPGMRPRPD